MIGAWVNNNVRQHGGTVTHWQGIKTGNPSPHGETTAFSRIFKQSFRDGNSTKPWNMCQTHESATSCTSSKTNKTSADWDSHRQDRTDYQSHGVFLSRVYWLHHDIPRKCLAFYPDPTSRWDETSSKSDCT